MGNSLRILFFFWSANSILLWYWNWDFFVSLVKNSFSRVELKIIKAKANQIYHYHQNYIINESEKAKVFKNLYWVDLLYGNINLRDSRAGLPISIPFKIAKPRFLIWFQVFDLWSDPFRISFLNWHSDTLNFLFKGIFFVKFW